jgi:hypothetical protein
MPRATGRAQAHPDERSGSSRTNFSKTLCLISGGIPRPSSEIETLTSSPVAVVSIFIRDPSGEYFRRVLDEIIKRLSDGTGIDVYQRQVLIDINNHTVAAGGLFGAGEGDGNYLFDIR